MLPGLYDPFGPRKVFSINYIWMTNVAHRLVIKIKAPS